MGTHIYAVAQRKIDGKWRHLLDCPVSPIRVEWYSYTHYAFLTCSYTWPSDEDLVFSISNARGYPEDYDPLKSDTVEFFDPGPNGPDLDVNLPNGSLYGKSWLTIEELVNHDYDRIVTRNSETKPLREFLGEQFINFWKEMQSRGAERIIFGFD